jgi:hypothetical protein
MFSLRYFGLSPPVVSNGKKQSVRPRNAFARLHGFGRRPLGCLPLARANACLAADGTPLIQVGNGRAAHGHLLSPRPRHAGRTANWSAERCALITLTFEDAWAQSADRRNYEALQAKDRFEARLLAIIEARANKQLTFSPANR